MIDREKVIKGLERLRKKEQFFTKQSDEKFPDDLHELIGVQDLAADAIALLKEQEAVEPKHNQLSPTDWFCGKCGMCISRFHDYCPSCGREVKWE